MADPAKSGTDLARMGALERANAIAGNARTWLGTMPAAKRKHLAIAVTLAAAVIAGWAWYAGRPDWRVLYSELEAKDVQQVTQELTAAGIPYRMTGDGSGIQVDADQMDRARMEVATKGMPQTGRMGFELFDKPNWVGSEFDERVNYQRALEGELQHTIETLAIVRSARVHLVLPKSSEFGENPQQAKASVVLQLRRSSMAPPQVDAIRSLVAGAVENLSSSDVSLVDADGKLNFAAPTQGQAAGDEEHTLEDKLVAMLEPLAGAGNVRATVNVLYDGGTVEKTDEVYDPSQVATLTMHRSEQSTGPGKSRAGGVPGTTSNTPGAQAAPAQGSAAQAGVPPLLQTAATKDPAGARQGGLPVYPQGTQSSDGATATDESGTYAVSRHLTHSEEGPGRVRRVTAAIVVNDRMTLEGADKQQKTVWKSRTKDEMQRLQQLARATVGFDATRGDDVVIENIGFSSNEPSLATTGMAKIMDQAQGVLHSQPGMLKLLGVSAMGLLLVFTVLRPITRQVVTTLSAGSAAALSAENNAATTQQMAPFGGGPIPNLLGAGASSDPRDVYQQISEHIQRETEQSTRLISSWINAGSQEVG